MKKALLSWSSGKDSAWSLYKLQQQFDIDAVGLFCTVNQKFECVAMHAARNELLQIQAQCVDLSVQLIQIPYPCSNAHTTSIMNDFTVL